MNLPKTLPNESLYSRIVRGLSTSGMREIDFMRRAFGNHRISLHPYLTVGIDRFEPLSGSDIWHHLSEETLFNLYSYYMPRRAKRIHAAIINSDANKAIRACNMASFSEMEVLQLKYCPICAREDILLYGVSYWHISHQIPGVSACYIHPVWLKSEPMPKRPNVRIGFYPKHISLTSSSTQVAHEFAKFCHERVFTDMLSRESFNLAQLKLELFDLGLMTEKGRLKNTKIKKEIQALSQPLRLPITISNPLYKVGYKYLHAMFDGKTTQHPFKYLLLSFYIARAKQTPLPSEVKNSSLNHGANVIPTIISMLQRQISMNKISVKTGKSRTFIKRVALLNNIQIKTLPRQLSTNKYSKVIMMGVRGFKRQSIAERTGLSIGYVEQILSSQDGLIEWRKRCKYESTRRRYQSDILKYMNKHPSDIKQQVKIACYRAFHWLYRNEREWLNKTLPAPIKRSYHYKVDWAARDIETAEIVKVMMQASDAPSTLSDLDRRLGGHSWMLKNRYRMPKSLNVFLEYHDTYPQSELPKHVKSRA